MNVQAQAGYRPHSIPGRRKYRFSYCKRPNPVLSGRQLGWPSRDGSLELPDHAQIQILSRLDIHNGLSAIPSQDYITYRVLGQHASPQQRTLTAEHLQRRAA